MSPARTIAPSLLASVAQLIRELGGWWLDQLTELLPERLTRWLTDAGRRSLLLLSERETVHLLVRDDWGRIRRQESIASGADLANAIAALLQRSGLRRDEVVLGLALPSEKFFSREITLPREVGKSLDAVARRDLLHNTPFREDDIFYDHQATPSSAKIVVKQTVIRRTLVEDAAAEIGIDPEELDFLGVGTAAQMPEPPTRLRLRDKAKAGRWLPVAFAALAASCAALMLIAVLLEYQQQQATLDALRAELATARKQAQQVRASLQSVDLKLAVRTELRSRKRDGVGLLELWEEVTRVLPDDCWLQELKLSKSGEKSEHRLTLSGFSASAANLVEVLDKSRLLDNAALTAPISLDPIEKRERFVLDALVRNKNAKVTP